MNLINSMPASKTLHDFDNSNYSAPTHVSSKPETFESHLLPGDDVVSISRKKIESDSHLSLIQPLVPPEINVGVFPWAPVRLAFIESSPLAVLENAEPFRALLLLIVKSWKQIPSGTLPSDERELAWLAGFGRDIGAWKNVRNAVMQDWILASDNRWHHPEIASWVQQAWASKLKTEAQSEKQRSRAQAGVEKRKNNSVEEPGAANEPQSSRGSAVAPQKTGRGAAINKEEEEYKEEEQYKEKNVKKNNKIDPTSFTSSFNTDENLKNTTLEEDNRLSDGSDPVIFVFKYWRDKTARNQSRLTSDKRKIIQDRLNEKFSVDFLCRAIDTASTNDFYQGNTLNNNRRFDTIESIFKNADRVDSLSSTSHKKQKISASSGLAGASLNAANAFATMFDGRTIEMPTADSNNTFEISNSEIIQ